MTKEMTWHAWWGFKFIWWCSSALMKSFLQFYPPFCKNMATCWNSENWRSIGKSEFINDKGITKEVMAWHVACDEVTKSYDGVLSLSWSRCYNLTPLCKNMATCWNSENWLSIGKSKFINDKGITKEVMT